jgi:hypothetical protein
MIPLWLLLTINLICFKKCIRNFKITKKSLHTFLVQYHKIIPNAYAVGIKVEVTVLSKK